MNLPGIIVILDYVLKVMEIACCHPKNKVASKRLAKKSVQLLLPVLESLEYTTLQ